MFLTIIIAQLQVLKKIASLFITLIFAPEASWLRFLIFILVIFLLVTMYRISAKFGREYQKKKEKEEKEKEKEDRSLFRKYVGDWGKIVGE